MKVKSVKVYVEHCESEVCMWNTVKSVKVYVEHCESEVCMWNTVRK